jgi:hypothetical protein
MKAKLACAIACAALSSAYAADTDHPTYRERFATCAHESKGLKGEEHHKFMSECLKGHGDHGAKADHAQKTSAAGTGAQQNRMKTCNEEARAKDLHGDERRAFMSSCLKG